MGLALIHNLFRKPFSELLLLTVVKVIALLVLAKILAPVITVIFIIACTIKAMSKSRVNALLVIGAIATYAMSWMLVGVYPNFLVSAIGALAIGLFGFTTIRATSWMMAAYKPITLPSFAMQRR